MLTQQISTESEASFVITVNPMIEVQVFDLIETAYANDQDNDWYASVVDKYGETYTGLLKSVETDTVVLGPDFSDANDFHVDCETVVKVTLWRVK